MNRVRRRHHAKVAGRSPTPSHRPLTPDPLEPPAKHAEGGHRPSCRPHNLAIVVLSIALATVLGHMLTIRGTRDAPN